MNQEQIDEHLADLSDDELIAALEVAKTDLAVAAADKPNSEWHEACFAGVLTYCQEVQKRGLRVVLLN